MCAFYKRCAWRLQVRSRRALEQAKEAQRVGGENLRLAAALRTLYGRSQAVNKAYGGELDNVVRTTK